MKIFEIYNQDMIDSTPDQQQLATGYYDPAEDKLNQRKTTDTRKPILLLKNLNRLKRMRALKKLEDAKREDLLGILYSLPDEQAAGGGGGAPF